jgi:predicted small secreted protein
MKKVTVLLLVVVLAALTGASCVTKSGGNNLDRGRRAAIDAAGRMDDALGN